MSAFPDYLIRLMSSVYLGLLLMGYASVGMTQAPIIKPGPPGESPSQLTADEAIDIAVTSYSPDDVVFMQDMIPHHHQAILIANSFHIGLIILK